MSDRVKAAMVRNLEKDVKKRLKIPRGQQLSPDIRKVIKETVDEATTTAAKSYISKAALVEAKGAFRVEDYTAAVRTRLGTALEGVLTVSESEDLQKILDENAKMLYAKMTALVSAGFTADQAFQLIVAEVSAKRGK